MLSKDEIIALIMEEPKLLQKTGKVLNTWRLIFGQSIIPKFNINYTEAYTDTGGFVTLYDFEGSTGYDEDGNAYDISDISRITDIDVDIYFERCYLTNIQLIEDVLFYPPEMRYVTLAYLMNIETEPIYINSLPLFDHTKIRFKFKDKIVIGIDNYPQILQSIEYMNCKLYPNENGLVKIVYETEVPYTMFYNRDVNEQLSNVMPGIPLLEHGLVVSFD